MRLSLSPRLEKNHPQAELFFWGTRQTSSIAREFGLFSRIIELDDSSFLRAFYSLLGNLAKIISIRPYWAFDLEMYSKLSSVFCLFTLAINRVGFISDTTRFRKYLHTHLIFFNRFHYVGELYNRMVLDTVPITDMDVFKRDFAKDLQIGFSANPSDTILININSGELFPLRKWPSVNYKTLIERLLDSYDCQIALTGTGNEREDIEKLIETVKHPRKNLIRNMAGVLTLRQLMWLMKECNIFITNDSGPMHLAVLLKIPFVALFGPTHPNHFLPDSRDSFIPIYNNYICSPCVHVLDEEYLPCKGAAPCMSSISIDQVFAAVCRIIERQTGVADIAHKHGSSKAYARD